ncbi:MAG: putative membrane protein [Candidatus Nanohaloarchaea archaeon]|jgi:uncharacterized membrane protein
MGLNKTDYLAALLLAALIAVTGYGFTELPGEIAIHFDASGQPDNYMPLIPGLLLLPGIGIITFLLFRYLPKIDPLGENYESFKDLFELLKLLLVGIFTYLQGLIVAWNLGYQYNISLMIAPVIFSAYLLTGKIMEKADRNWFIGIRTPWTLSSDRVWKETHEKTAPLMKLAAAISLAAIVLPEYSIYFYAVPAFAVALFSTVYSYWVYREQ